MTQGRKSQRYLSGRSKIIGFSGLSTDRHLYVEPGQVEPNLGFPGEKSLPASGTYYKLITVPNGTTFDRYWQEDLPATLVNGISIFDEGTLVGTANTVSKINFVGAAVTATASGTISTITVTPVSISTLAPPNARSGDLWWDSDEGELNVYYEDVDSAQWVIANSGIGTTAGGGGAGGGANVTVSSDPPGTASNGDLWWDSDLGELYIYYTDGDSNQWVETSGGSETVTISDDAPSNPNDGDLWWESDTGSLKIYYNDGDSAQWVDSNAGVLSSVSSFLTWSSNSAGIHTSLNVGIGTTNVSAVDANNTAVLAVGIVTAYKYFGDGSNLTGISGGASVTVSTSAPGSPSAGDLWWDSDDADLLVYFNDGNSSQWVSTNAGATGAQGAAGAQGATSAQGAQGAQGNQGAAGVAGAAGAAGAQGNQGATGSAGSTGAQGNQGAAGAQGNQGAAGAQGAQGNQGATGSASVANNADNRVITGGSGNNLNGEANLTFDGNLLNVNGGAAFGIGSTVGIGSTLYVSHGDLYLRDNHELNISNDSLTMRGNNGGNSFISNYVDPSDGSPGNLYISSGSGNLELDGAKNFSVKTNQDEQAILATQNGSVALYHDGGNKKLETSVKGIKVGTGVTIETNGQATFTGIVTAYKYYGDGSNLTGVPGSAGAQGAAGAAGAQGAQGATGGAQGAVGAQGAQGASGGGGGGGLSSRTTANAATGSIANAASANISITAAKTYALLKVQTSAAAWVTLYTDSTSRTNDASRGETTDPTPGSGVIAEVITSGAATQVMTPGVIGWNDDGTPASTVYAKVVNKSGSTQAITVTLHYLALES